MEIDPYEPRSYLIEPYDMEEIKGRKEEEEWAGGSRDWMERREEGEEEKLGDRGEEGRSLGSKLVWDVWLQLKENVESSF